MLWIILATLFVLGIAFYQSVQGVFSAVIMAIGTVACVALALNFYEPLGAMIAPGKAQYANPAALILVLFVSLMLYRVLVDRFLPGNLIPGALLDRLGGAAFGLIIALLLTGTLQLAIQMLPFERKILGYDAYDNQFNPASKFPYADSFTAGLMRTLSAGSFSALGAESDGSDSFGYRHNDLRLELWGLRNRPDRTSVHPGTETFDVAGAYDVTDQYNNDVPAYPGQEGEPSRVVALRVNVPDDADEKGVFHLSGTQFRLVDAEGQGYFPMGYLRYAGQWQAVTGSDGPGSLLLRYSKDQNVSYVDLLYRLPIEAADATEVGQFLAFRTSRIAAVPDLPGPEEPTHPSPVGALGGRQATGRVSFNDERPNYIFRPEEVRVFNDLPFTFEVESSGSIDDPAEISTSNMNITVIDRQLAGGELQGQNNELSQGRTRIDGFWAPEGYRVVQVIGRGPESAMLPNLSGIALDGRAEIRVPSGSGMAPRNVPAVGAWVKWREGDSARSRQQAQHTTYTPNIDVATGNEQAEDYLITSRAVSNAIRGVGQTITQHTGEGVEVGLIFLLPEGAVFEGLRLGSATIRPESSLSVE